MGASKALMAVSTTPSHHHLREGDDDLNNGNVSRGGNLRDDDDDVSDPVNERLTLAEKNERLQSQLRSLKEDLAHTRDDQAETTMDKIQKENGPVREHVSQGQEGWRHMPEFQKLLTVTN